MKKILILGATGSIGRSTLQVIKKHEDKFKLVGASANSNIGELMKIRDEFSVKMCGINNKNEIITLGRKIISKEDVNIYLAKNLDYDILVNGLVGSIGFYPTYHAIRRDKIVALANKETVVAYGSIIKKELKLHPKSSIRPVDSEHSALWQLIEMNGIERIAKCYITASGGVPFKMKKENPTLNEILNHPVWKMGKKVTVDSSTMVNKGLEVIEASVLFNLKPSQIGVLIHPQSIVHAMVMLNDGTMISHMALPDMILPIEYALFYPERPKECMIKKISEDENFSLQFYPAPYGKHLALKLAYNVLEKGKTWPAVYNASNEKAVELFLKGEIQFEGILKLIEGVLASHCPPAKLTIESIAESERWAKEKTTEIGEMR